MLTRKQEAAVRLLERALSSVGEDLSELLENRDSQICISLRLLTQAIPEMLSNARESLFDDAVRTGIPVFENFNTCCKVLVSQIDEIIMSPAFCGILYSAIEDMAQIAPSVSWMFPLSIGIECFEMSGFEGLLNEDGNLTTRAHAAAVSLVDMGLLDDSVLDNLPEADRSHAVLGGRDLR